MSNTSCPDVLFAGAHCSMKAFFALGDLGGPYLRRLSASRPSIEACRWVKNTLTGRLVTGLFSRTTAMLLFAYQSPPIP